MRKKRTKKAKQYICLSSLLTLILDHLLGGQQMSVEKVEINDSLITLCNKPKNVAPLSISMGGMMVP